MVVCILGFGDKLCALIASGERCQCGGARTMIISKKYVPMLCLVGMYCKLILAAHCIWSTNTTAEYWTLYYR
jgi:hypothetical protein